MATSRWAWWHQAAGPDDYRIRELLRGIWDLHAMYGLATWLWRGQPNSAHDITPAVHSRIAEVGTDDDNVKACTNDLIEAAREARLDLHEGIQLPDLAVLAMLQHHGAATPLLDVSLDPLVGLYMAVVSADPDDASHDGTLFAIRKPTQILPPFVSEPFQEVYDALPADAVVMYTAPDVSERLRIQRGHFVLGRVDKRFRTTLPLGIESPRKVGGIGQTWLYRFMDRRGQPGGLLRPTNDVDAAVFRVTAKFKRTLRGWLEERSGLTPAFVLPTAWHRPHLDAFCSSHGRGMPWA